MTTTAQRPSTRKPQRYLRWLIRSARGQGVLQIKMVHSTTREEIFKYLITPIQSDFGEGFEVEEIGGDCSKYHVNLDGEQSICTCKGFEKWNRCKHKDALLQMQQDGNL